MDRTESSETGYCRASLRSVLRALVLWVAAFALIPIALMGPLVGRTVYGGSMAAVWHELSSRVLQFLLPGLVFGVYIGWVVKHKPRFWAVVSTAGPVLLLIVMGRYRIHLFMGEDPWFYYKALGHYVGGILSAGAGGFLGAIIGRRLLRRRRRLTAPQAPVGG